MGRANVSGWMKIMQRQNQRARGNVSGLVAAADWSASAQGERRQHPRPLLRERTVPCTAVTWHAPPVVARRSRRAAGSARAAAAGARRQRRCGAPRQRYSASLAAPFAMSALPLPGAAAPWQLDDFFWSPEMRVRPATPSHPRVPRPMRSARPHAARPDRLRRAQAAAPRGATATEDDALRLAFASFCEHGGEAAPAAPPCHATPGGRAAHTLCQIPSCGASLHTLRPYHKRAKCVGNTARGAPRAAARSRRGSHPQRAPHAHSHRGRRLCAEHLLADECVLAGGGRWRFCQARAGAACGCHSRCSGLTLAHAAPPQRCHRLQPLRDFDGAKHTARARSAARSPLARRAEPRRCHRLPRSAPLRWRHTPRAATRARPDPPAAP